MEKILDLPKVESYLAKDHPDKGPGVNSNDEHMGSTPFGASCTVSLSVPVAPPDIDRRGVVDGVRVSDRI